MNRSSVMLNGRRQSAFEVYLRTGRRGTDWCRQDIEVKFNPWHDPQDGRFTFSGQGRYYGAGADVEETGGTGRSGRWQKRAGIDSAGPDYSRLDPRNPRNYKVYIVKPGDTLSGIARFRKGLTVADLEWLNRISAGAPLQIGQKVKVPNQELLEAGRDAKNRFIALWLYAETHNHHLPPDPAHPPSIEQQINDPTYWHPVRKNGYRYDLDLAERPREIRGEVSIDATAMRSRRNQRSAGGADRRATDDGGHYIAARFNGPSDAFNHFAQDANFNRGIYRAMEDGWAASVRAGHRVMVDIVPHYDGLSLRPDRIKVTWFVDGEKRSRTFENEHRSKRRGE
ncbi:LysM domain-containing protein [Hephaestia caeni]|uniref:LysM domain-containing protein n=1 Tax=Hephaestia caeni TaxID=645617 RepID=A0A397NJI3_9SPHN|nr:DNA/RNA non-specific endonuclease [Hephaestia caeni]RIA35447.1 LysM domain-containing protein [Hephaestia caeni]